MTKTDYVKTILAAVLVSAILVFALVAPQLGVNVRTWGPQIKAQQEAAEKAEYNRVCLGKSA